MYSEIGFFNLFLFYKRRTWEERVDDHPTAHLIQSKFETVAIESPRLSKLEFMYKNNYNKKAKIEIRSYAIEKYLLLSKKHI